MYSSHGNPSQSYGASLAIWDHAACYLLPDTSEHARLTPASQPASPVLDLPTPEGWKAELR